MSFPEACRQRFSPGTPISPRSSLINDFSLRGKKKTKIEVIFNSIKLNS